MVKDLFIDEVVGMVLASVKRGGESAPIDHRQWIVLCETERAMLITQALLVQHTSVEYLNDATPAELVDFQNGMLRVFITRMSSLRGVQVAANGVVAIASTHVASDTEILRARNMVFAPVVFTCCFHQLRIV